MVFATKRLSSLLFLLCFNENSIVKFRNTFLFVCLKGYQRPRETYYRPLPISLIAGVSVGLLLLLLAIVIALVLRKKKQRRRITDLLHGEGRKTHRDLINSNSMHPLRLRSSRQFYLQLHAGTFIFEYCF